MTIEVIPSVSGLKYTHGDGFYFRLSQKLHNKLYLICQVKSCRARGNVPINFSNVEKINVRGEHNHPPDFYELEFCQLEKKILERSSKESSSLRKIFAEETAKASPKTVSRLNYPSFLRRMQRRRQFVVRAVPRSLAEFSKHMQSVEYKDFAFINGEKFFISAIGNHSLLFISPTMRELLKWEDQEFVIYLTKKIICQNLRSVMIIAKVVSNVAFPIAYVAMKMQNNSIFCDIFQKIQEEEPLWNPAVFFVGTDKTLNCAIREEFNKCEIMNSWFHRAQELRKEVKNLDLIDLLHSDADFFNCIELLQALPLLPSEFMNPGFEIIKEKLAPLFAKSGLTQLFEYVENNWLKDRNLNKVSLFAKSNSLKMEIKLLHRQFMSSFRSNTRREVIWSFTKGLVAVEKKYADAFKEFLSKDTPPKWTGNCSFRSQEKRILNAMSSFTNGKLTTDAFLETVAKTAINILELIDDDVEKELSDEESPDKDTDTNKLSSKDVTMKQATDDDDNYIIDFDDFIVEEIEEEEFSDENYGATVNCTPSTETEPTTKAPVKRKALNDEKFVPVITVVQDDSDNIEIKIENMSNQRNSVSFDDNSVNSFKNANKLQDDRKLFFGSDCLKVKVKELDNDNSCIYHACVICKLRKYSFACQPCGHMCLCNICSNNVVKICPICSKQILWTQEIFLAHAI